MHKKYNLSIGVMFKNEAHIMDEWLKHYLRIGVDHIYMINHSSNDNYMDILNDYMKEKVVTLLESNHKPKKYAQVQQYNEKITPHVKDSQWFAFLDMDEFLYSRENNKIINILNKSKYNCYDVPWINFGSNGLLDTPESVIKSFNKRANYNNPNHNFLALRQTKALFDTDYFERVVELHYIYDKRNLMLIKENHVFNRHEVVKRNKHFRFSEYDIDRTDLAINHYSVQAKNWYNKIKNKKLAGNSAQVKYNSKYWRLMDTNEIEDNILRDQVYK